MTTVARAFQISLLTLIRIQSFYLMSAPHQLCCTKLTSNKMTSQIYCWFVSHIYMYMYIYIYITAGSTVLAFWASSVQCRHMHVYMYVCVCIYRYLYILFFFGMFPFCPWASHNNYLFFQAIKFKMAVKLVKSSITMVCCNPSQPQDWDINIILMLKERRMYLIWERFWSFCMLFLPKSITYYYISQVPCALWLVDLVVHTLKYWPLDFVVCFPAQFNFQDI